MIKSTFSIIGSIVITIILCVRVVNAESLDEVVVIGCLALSTGAISFYLLFEKKIKSDNFISQNNHSAKNIVTTYAITIFLLLVLEVFLLFTPLENNLFKIPRTILMLLVLAGISTLSALIYSERKKGKDKKSL